MNKIKIRDVEMSSLAPLIKEVIASGGEAEITVTGNSMYPLLKHRESYVKLAHAEKVMIGDVALFCRENGAYILHRVVDTVNGEYVFCGDNQWRLEKGIKESQIIAVMTQYKRSKKWVFSTALPYRCYWKIWILLRPLRHVLDSCLRRIKRLLPKGKA